MQSLGFNGSIDSALGEPESSQLRTGYESLLPISQFE